MNRSITQESPSLVCWEYSLRGTGLSGHTLYSGELRLDHPNVLLLCQWCYRTSLPPFLGCRMPLAKGGGGRINRFASCRILLVCSACRWWMKNQRHNPWYGTGDVFCAYIHGMGHVMCAAVVFSIIRVCVGRVLSLWWVFLLRTPPGVCMRRRVHWRSAVLRTDVYDDDSTCVEFASLCDCMSCDSRPCCPVSLHMIELLWVHCVYMWHYSRPCCSVCGHMIEPL